MSWFIRVVTAGGRTEMIQETFASKAKAQKMARELKRLYPEWKRVTATKTWGASNPRQPGKRVSKALKNYVKQQVGLPKQWTDAQVRVDEQGNVKLKFKNPAKLNGATRAVKGVKAVASRNGGTQAKRRKA